MKKKRIILITILIIICILGGSLILIKIKNNKVKLDKLKIKKEITVSLMSEVLKPREFFENFKDDDKIIVSYYLNNDKIEMQEKYREIGNYKVIIVCANKKYESNLNVVDEEAPALELKELEIFKDDEYKIDDFITSCNDNSEKECLLSFKEEYKYEDVGTYDITIIAKDESGNETLKTTKLKIKENNLNDNSKKNNNKKSLTSSSKTKSDNNGIKFVKHESEVTTEEKDYKYGLKSTVTTNKTYDLYSDGSKKNEKTTTRTTYNRSGYNATTDEMLAEANQVYDSNMSLINGVLNYTNGYRSEVGVDPLNLDRNLSIAATIRALEMAYSGKFSHERPNGSSCFTIFDDRKISSSNKGENIAMGQRSAESVSTSWRNSPGHYENMINSSFKRIGIGVFKFDGSFYWVQIFSD